MITAMRTKARGPLGATPLSGLAQINVICGRNNSGKSTLLGAICADPPPIIGQQLGQEAADALFKLALTASEVRNHAEHLHAELRAAVQRAIEKHTDSLWFSDEVAEFIAA